MPSLGVTSGPTELALPLRPETPQYPRHPPSSTSGAVGGERLLAGSSAQNDINAVKDLRARLRPQTPDPLGEE